MAGPATLAAVGEVLHRRLLPPVQLQDAFREGVPSLLPVRRVELRGLVVPHGHEARLRGLDGRNLRSRRRGQRADAAARRPEPHEREGTRERLLPPDLGRLHPVRAGNVRTHNHVLDDAVHLQPVVGGVEDGRSELVEAFLVQRPERHLYGMLLGRRGTAVNLDYGVILEDEPGVRHPLVVHVVHERGEHHHELRQRIGADSERAGGHGRYVLLLVLERRADPVQELVGRHGDVAGVVEVVEGDFPIHGGDPRHVLKELDLRLGADGNVARDIDITPVVILAIRHRREHDHLRQLLREGEVLVLLRRNESIQEGVDFGVGRVGAGVAVVHDLQ
mmetsp:Transcript_4823/g.10363  ORF Transcript_4823/g.10363 Transcript_4823/m.10363 type:complete len:333 (-) Transcript_4823:1456-2454(-)